jgi:hypothetical protein
MGVSLQQTQGFDDTVLQQYGKAGLLSSTSPTGAVVFTFQVNQGAQQVQEYATAMEHSGLFQSVVVKGIEMLQGCERHLLPAPVPVPPLASPPVR